jgi:hypothetical protein
VKFISPLVLLVTLILPPRPLDASNGATHPLPRAERVRLRRALRAALAAVPAPRGPYALDRESVSERVATDAPYDAGAKRWRAPATAGAERVYEAAGQGEGAQEPEPIEVLVELNGAWEIPRGLASVGGDPTLVSIPGAAAVEVAMVAPESDGGRVSLPLPAGWAANRLAELQLYFGTEEEERALLASIEGGPPWEIPPRTSRGPARPSDVQIATVTLHGPKGAIEALAKRVGAGAIRRLLAP